MRDFSDTAANVERKLPSAWINAPVLLAWKELPELGPLIKREFSEEGDVEQVRFLNRLKASFFIDDILTLGSHASV